MSKIIVLDELTAAQIAAGEVIERPASVVKETVENALDAGATAITVEIKGGGIRFIRITDNGCGFEADDAVIAFDKHATSKITSGADLEQIQTLGFRGEALASIAAVADVELLSRTEDADMGIYVHIKGGDVLDQGPKGCAKGTVLTVRELFYNTPARYKFLKKDQTEAGYISDIVQKLAMANPNVSFRLISNGQEILRTPGGGDLRAAVYSIFGRETAANLLAVDYTENDVHVSGFVGVRDAVYGNRNRQIFYVNNRNIKSKLITAALDEAYQTVTMKHKFPFAVLHIQVAPGKVDVNVHPAKTEVRFAEESAVFRAVLHSVSSALLVDNRGGTPIENDIKTQKLPEITVFEDKSVDNSVEKQKVLWKSPVEPQKNTENVTEHPVKMADWSKKQTNQPVATAQILSFYDVLKENSAVVAEKPVDKPEKPVDNIVDTAVDNFSGFGTMTYNENDIYTEAQIIGQAFDTYIILQKGNELALVDQHAAHERLMYEEIRASLQAAGEAPAVSPMLIPVTVRLAPSEYILLQEYKELFTKIGFEIDDFGTDTVIVRAVPSILSDADPETLILDSLADMQRGKGPKEVIFQDEAIYTMACKAAVKANQKLSEAEIQTLLKKLSKLENSCTCPHGRPIVVRLTKHEIEKRFKRCL
ncbi:MAG: DNA mismatch repair endonuclease MutL [Clostridia bacterium]|nr:DNA mismatch repair endonuclease MutL [Clostridia bacterium]